MALSAAIESWIGRYQRRAGRDAAESDGLLGIEIKDAIPVHGMCGMRILVRTQRRKDRIEGGDWRGRRTRHGRTECVETPKSDGIVHRQTRSFRLPRLHDPARDPDVIHQSVAPDTALDQPTKSQLIRNRRFLVGLRGSLEHDLAVHPQGDGLVVQTCEDVVPLAVRDIDLRGEIAAASRQVDAEITATVMGVDFPMPGRTLRPAGGDDVVSFLRIQTDPRFDGARPAKSLRRCGHDLPSPQSLAELGRRRRFALRRFIRNDQSRLGRDRATDGEGPILRLRSGREIVQLGNEVPQSVQVVQETTFGVFHGMVKNTDGPGVSAGPDLLQYLEVFRPDADRQDLAPLGIAADVHAVQIEAQQVRQHELEGFVQARQVAMAMMKVIDDPDVRDSVVLFQVLTDGDHVLGLAAPATMVINRDLAPDLRRLGDRRQQAFGGALDLRLLGFALPVHHDPDLRMQLVFLEKSEGLVMDGPEGEELDALLLIR